MLLVWAFGRGKGDMAPLATFRSAGGMQKKAKNMCGGLPATYAAVVSGQLGRRRLLSLLQVQLLSLLQVQLPPGQLLPLQQQRLSPLTGGRPHVAAEQTDTIYTDSWQCSVLT